MSKWLAFSTCTRQACIGNCDRNRSGGVTVNASDDLRGAAVALVEAAGGVGGDLNGLYELQAGGQFMSEKE